jgi:hypothetical protein
MKSDDFKQKTHKVLDDLAEYIERLEQKAGEIADDAKVEYHEQLEYLKGIRDRLSSKLNEYEIIADDKWDVIKESAANFFGTVSESWKENFANVSEAFRKEQRKSSGERQNESKARHDADAPDYTEDHNI